VKVKATPRCTKIASNVATGIRDSRAFRKQCERDSYYHQPHRFADSAIEENEPSLIAGLLDRNETKSLSGIPGLANLPGVGYAFGSEAIRRMKTSC
jgi:hypothetical protein